MVASMLELFRAAVLQSWNGIVVTDADASAGYRVQIANQAFCEMTGYSQDELVGRTLKMLQGPDTDPAVIDHLRACLREERFFEGTTTNYRKDGTPYIVRWNISPVRDDAGVLTNFVSVQQDITARVLAEQRSRLLERAFDATSEPVVITDLRGRIVFANRAFSELTGHPPEALLGRTHRELGVEDEDEGFCAAMPGVLATGQAFRGRSVGRRRDGSTFHWEQSISLVRAESGQPTHVVGASRDVSDHVRREDALREAASRDKLTGLFNRRHGEHLLGTAFGEAQGSGRPLAVLLCDVDHFKQVNDRFGHAAGDRVLVDVARILRQSVRGSDVVVRWGGEEFLVVLPGCGPAPALELAERIRRRVADHEDAEVGKVSASIGVASFAGDEAIDALLGRADDALYAAKRGGRNRVWTDASASG